MGTSSSRMEREVIALKANIVALQRKQEGRISAAVKETEEQLARELEKKIEAERIRADQIEEERCVAQLQNELLTEMVAAEQVNVKLQERRNEALKWELLRQGGSQERFDTIAKEIPDLGRTLAADTTDILHGAAKHDMAEAIEHVVCGMSEVKDELQEAFLARDKGNTGALGGSDFKDALRESLPDMPREDRQLLMLRFVREVDQSVDYSEFLDFCERKAKSRERLKMSLTGALAVTGSAGFRATIGAGGSGCSPSKGREVALTFPASTNAANQSKPFFMTAQMLARSADDSRSMDNPPQVQNEASEKHMKAVTAGAPGGVGSRSQRYSVLSQETVDPTYAELTEDKAATCIAQRGAALELLLKENDKKNSGVISVKAFSECLRALDPDTGVDGEGQLSRADRKVLYRKWAIHGQVRYDDFLQAYGFAHPSAHTQEEPDVGGARRAKNSTSAAEYVTDDRRVSEADELRARARIVLTHLCEVLEEDGEELFLAAFEKQDPRDYRSLDEDGFVDALADLAPEVTSHQALDVFEALSTAEARGVDYDKLIKDLRVMAKGSGGIAATEHPRRFQSGDAVQLRVATVRGAIQWVPARVVCQDGDGRYTVRVKSNSRGGGMTKKSSVAEADLRETVPMDDSTVRQNAGIKVRPGSRKKTSEPGIPFVERAKRLLGKCSCMGTDVPGHVISRPPKRKNVSTKISRREVAGEIPRASETHGTRYSSSDEDLSPRRRRSPRKGGEDRWDPLDDNASSESDACSEDDEGKVSPSALSPTAGGDGYRRKVRRIVELPVIVEASPSSLQRPRQRSSSKTGSVNNSSNRSQQALSSIPIKSPPSSARRGSKSAAGSPVAKVGLNTTNGGLKALEHLEHSNIEDKFDLYKKRTKNALSPRGSRSGAGTVRLNSARLPSR